MCFLATISRKKESIVNNSMIYRIGLYLFLYVPYMYSLSLLFLSLSLSLSFSLSLCKIQMASLKFISVNARGLNSKEKREKVNN